MLCLLGAVQIALIGLSVLMQLVYGMTLVFKGHYFNNCLMQTRSDFFVIFLSSYFIPMFLII